MRHHQQYPRKQQANKLTNNDFEVAPTGGGDEEQVCDLTLLLKFLETWF